MVRWPGDKDDFFWKGFTTIGSVGLSSGLALYLRRVIKWRSGDGGLKEQVQQSVNGFELVAR